MLTVNNLIGFGVGGRSRITVWSSTDKSAKVVLSTTALANDTAGYSGSFTSWGSVRATNSSNIGKLYFEIVALNVAAGANTDYGIGDGAFSLTSSPGASSARVTYNNTGVTRNSGFTAGTTPATAIVTNDVIMFAIDQTAGKAWIGSNGTWFSSGDPAAGSNPWVTFTGGTALFPVVTLSLAGDTCKLVCFDGAYVAPSGYSYWDS